MKLNKRIKEVFDKMVRLEIPRKNRRQYIKNVFICGFKCGLEYQILNDKLDELTANHVYAEDAVTKINLAFSNALDRYSEENYRHGLNHPYLDHPHRPF